MSDMDSATGEFGKRFYGKYRGLVVENVDPEQIGRVLVQVPDVLGVIPSSWAMPCVPAAGIQSGCFIVPPIGSQVWVEFEQGNPDYPIWTGGFWGLVADVPIFATAPPAIPPGQNIVLQTTGQNMIIVSDSPPTPMSGGIVLKSTSGAMIVVNDTGIYISNGMGAIITMVGPAVNEYWGIDRYCDLRFGYANDERKTTCQDQFSYGRHGAVRAWRTGYAYRAEPGGHGFRHAGGDYLLALRDRRMCVYSIGRQRSLRYRTVDCRHDIRGFPTATAGHHERRLDLRTDRHADDSGRSPDALHSQHRKGIVSTNVNFPYQFDGRGRTEDAMQAYVRQLVEQVLFTSPGERVNLPDFGSGLLQLTFAPNSMEMAAATQFTVQAALQKWLSGYIRVQSVVATAKESQLTVTVTFAAQHRSHASTDLRLRRQPMTFLAAMKSARRRYAAIRC